MGHLTYLAVLAACLVVTLPLELVLRLRVYSQWRRLLTTIAAVLVAFGGWDLVAVHRHQWSYVRSRVVAELPGRLPLEEVLFFVVIPICVVLTFEAVRRLRPSWADES